MSKKPNILFLLTDDQRYNTIHALGNDEIITPNIDRLVKMGTSFTHAHIPGGTSGAVCMPSRAMINSGRTLFHLQGEGQGIPEDHITLGETLLKNEYHCFGSGKWHNGPSAHARSFNDGANIFFGGMWDHWNVPVCDHDPTGYYDNVINFVGNFQKDNNKWRVHCDRFNPGVHSSELLSTSTVKFINEYDKDEPFFCYTAFLAPHDPRTMPIEYYNMYDPEKITLPESFRVEPLDYGVHEVRDEVLAAYPRDPMEIKKQIAEYYGMITHLDSEIGKILDALEAKGELENTIIVLAGDNGLGMGCHGLMGKQSNYDHSIRIPLIMAGPNIPKDKKTDNYVYLLDIYPTLCDLIGAEIPSSVEGKSFAKMFTDDSFVTRENLYFVYNDLMRSVKDRQFKLIEFRNGIKKTELYDLINDPNEVNDLSNKAEYADKIAELREIMFTYRKEWNDDDHKYGQSYWGNF